VLTAKLYDNEEYEKSLRRRFEDAVVGDEDQNSGHQEFARTMYHRCMWILRGSLKSSQKKQPEDSSQKMSIIYALMEIERACE
jgi:hypothetical protein